MKKLQGTEYLNYILASARLGRRTCAHAAGAITDAMRTAHKLETGADDDFRVLTQDDLIAMRTQATQTMTSLLAGIAAVSLLVGGIGIMNIMLVSVTERTREIGLRLAIGARGADVLLQFLIEAVVISVVGRRHRHRPRLRRLGVPARLPRHGRRSCRPTPRSSAVAFSAASASSSGSIRPARRRRSIRSRR